MILPTCSLVDLVDDGEEKEGSAVMEELEPSSARSLETYVDFRVGIVSSGQGEKRESFALKGCPATKVLEEMGWEMARKYTYDDLRLWYPSPIKKEYS